MSLNLSPLRYDLTAITRGDTFPAIQFADSAADTDLSRVRMKVCNASGSTVISLDSDATGITINSSTAGSWNFTIGPISAATTEDLAAGLYAYDIETIDSAGSVRTEFDGNWEILPQITDV